MAGNLDLPNTWLHTDAAKAYRVVALHTAAQEFVTHESGEYVRNGVSTNLAEGHLSQLKRSIDGTYHHVSADHLDRYLTTSSTPPVEWLIHSGSGAWWVRPVGGAD